MEPTGFIGVTVTLDDVATEDIPQIPANGNSPDFFVHSSMDSCGFLAAFLP